MFAASAFAVEMVPEPLWELSAKKMLSALRWKELRDHTLAEAGFRCAACGGDGDGRPLQCHEQWAYDDDALVQKLVALVALCERCHLAKTPGRAAWLASSQVRYAHLPQQVLALVAHLNGWDQRTAAAYVRWCAAVNVARSAFAWSQDLSAVARPSDVDGPGSAALCPRCFLLVPAASLSAGSCDH